MCRGSNEHINNSGFQISAGTEGDNILQTCLLAASKTNIVVSKMFGLGGCMQRYMKEYTTMGVCMCAFCRLRLSGASRLS